MCTPEDIYQRLLSPLVLGNQTQRCAPTSLSFVLILYPKWPPRVKVKGILWLQEMHYDLIFASLMTYYVSIIFDTPNSLADKILKGRILIILSGINNKIKRNIFQTQSHRKNISWLQLLKRTATKSKSYNTKWFKFSSQEMNLS